MAAQIPLQVIDHEVVAVPFDTTGLTKFFGRGSTKADADGIYSLLSRHQAFATALAAAMESVGLDVSAHTRVFSEAHNNQTSFRLVDDVNTYTSGKARIRSDDIHYYLEDGARVLTCALYAWVDTSDARWRREQERKTRALAVQVEQLQTTAAADKLHINEVEAAAERLRRHLQQREHALRERLDEVLALQQEVGRLERERVALRVDLAESHAALNTLQESYAQARRRHRTEIARRDTLLRSAYAEIHALEKGLRQKNLTIRAQQHRISKLGAEIAGLRNELARIQHTHQQEIALIQRQLHSALEQVDDLQSRLATSLRKKTLDSLAHNVESRSLMHLTEIYQAKVESLEQVLSAGLSAPTAARLPPPESETRSTSREPADGAYHAPYERPHPDESKTSVPSPSVDEPLHQRGHSRLAHAFASLQKSAVSLHRLLYQSFTSWAWWHILLGSWALLHCATFLPPLLRYKWHGQPMTELIVFVLARPDLRPSREYVLKTLRNYGLYGQALRFLLTYILLYLSSIGFFLMPRRRYGTPLDLLLWRGQQRMQAGDQKGS
ncbi:MAG: hypothetical protein Q8R28_02995, partial [Dehalococcoidia bacterium]|nr:hypothetical protein [Dehalococcoidia bacterium]